jgi:hypothetical protein
MKTCNEYKLVSHSISHRNTSFLAGFREAHGDALMGDVGQPPHVCEDGDIRPPDEEGILIHVQRTRSFIKHQMQTAWKIGKFMESLEGQDRGV